MIYCLKFYTTQKVAFYNKSKVPIDDMNYKKFEKDKSKFGEKA